MSFDQQPDSIESECLDRYRKLQKRCDGYVKEIEALTRRVAELQGSTVFSDVLAERQAQRGLWGDEHDDAHLNGELVRAAACYAVAPVVLKFPGKDAWPLWPWRAKDLGGQSRRNMVKAAALLIAEIERLDRRSIS